MSWQKQEQPTLLETVMTLVKHQVKKLCTTEGKCKKEMICQEEDKLCKRSWEVNKENVDQEEDWPGLQMLLIASGRERKLMVVVVQPPCVTTACR